MPHQPRPNNRDVIHPIDFLYEIAYIPDGLALGMRIAFKITQVVAFCHRGFWRIGRLTAWRRDNPTFTHWRK